MELDSEKVFEIEKLKDELEHQRKVIEVYKQWANDILKSDDVDFTDDAFDSFECKLRLIEEYAKGPVEPRHPILYIDVMVSEDDEPKIVYCNLADNNTFDVINKMEFLYPVERLSKVAQEKGITIFWNIMYRTLTKCYDFKQEWI